MATAELALAGLGAASSKVTGRPAGTFTTRFCGACTKQPPCSRQLAAVLCKIARTEYAQLHFPGTFLRGG